MKRDESCFGSSDAVCMHAHTRLRACTANMHSNSGAVLDAKMLVSAGKTAVELKLTRCYAWHICMPVCMRAMYTHMTSDTSTPE